MTRGRFACLVLLVVAAVLTTAAPAMAATFNKLDVLSDANFRDSHSMSAAQIQTFLNGQPSGLKLLTIADHNGVLKSAAVIIADACVYWNVNPKVMLATLQKEQSLLGTVHPTQRQLDWAVGMGYTDTVVYTQYQGFGNQVWCGTRALSNYEVTYGWYPGKTMSVLDLSGAWITITPANAATFAQYTYTPHVSGVQLFWSCYNRYFGDPLGWPPVAGGGAVTGTVRAVGGAALSGAAVSVSLGPSAFTAADGGYTVAGISPGAHTVTFAQPGYASQTASVTISAAATITLDATLAAIPTTGTVRGTVTVAGGAALSGVRVALAGSGNTTTSADGTYLMRDIPVGTRSITFSRYGYVAQSFSRLVAPGATVTLNAALVQTGNLTGAVIASGSPLPGVRVSLSAPASHLIDYAQTWLGVPYLWGGTSRTGVDCSGLTQAIADEVGYHSFPRTAEAQWAYFQVLGWTVAQPRPGDFVYFRSSASPSGHHTALYVAAGTVIEAPGSGKLVRVAGIPSLEVLGYGRLQGGPSTTTAADGSYSLPRLEPSDYSVAVAVAGYVRQSVAITVLTGETATVNMALVRAGGLRGRVRTAAGATLPGASVSIANVASLTTPADGTYAIPGLAPGAYTMTFACTGYLSTSLRVTVPAGATSTVDATLSLKPTAVATTISIKTSALGVRTGGVATLSGAVTPTGTVGTNIVAYVQKAGSARWTYSSNRTVYLLAGKAAWQYKYRFVSGMRKGTYRFKAAVPATAAFLPSQSGVVSIVLR